MFSPNAICAVAALFVAGMVWLRTRMHYRPDASGRRALTGAGAGYFAALALLLLSGWFAAPPLARRLSPAVAVAPALARVVWFLAAYYLFIPVHLLLKARGVAVFRPRGLPNGGWRGL
jgi:hypothetical protein